jgi:hypothetical protein
MAVAAADNPNKYLDPAAFAAMVQRMGGDEAATRRSLTALGFNLPGAEPAMEGGKDPMVQDFLQKILETSDPNFPAPTLESYEKAARGVERGVNFVTPPPKDTEAATLMQMERRERIAQLDQLDDETDMTGSNAVSASTSLQRPADDKPSPLGGSFIQDMFQSEPEPLKETAQLLEEKPELKEEPVDEIVEVEVDEEPGFMASKPIDFKTTYKQSAETNILNQQAKESALKAIEFAQAQYDFMDKNFDIKIDVDALTKNIDQSISDYTTKIDEIAQEEISPPFEGDTMRKVLAVIGAALGAAASTFGGTPNYALQIIDKAIDREQQRKLKSKEMRMLSAREQRRILQEQRGQMLQFALNKTNQAIQAAQMKGQAAQSLSTLQMLKAQLEQGAQQTIDTITASAIKNYFAMMSQVMTRERGKGRNYIPGLGVITGNPSKEDLTRIKKEGEQFSVGYSEIMKNREIAIEMMDKLDQEGAINTTVQSGLGIRGLKGKQYKNLEQAATLIFLKYKNDIAKVGQAMSAAEQQLVERVLPQTTLATITLGELRIALDELDRFLESRAYGLQMGMGIMPTQRDLNFQEFAGMYGQQEKPKEVPGVKKVTD